MRWLSLNDIQQGLERKIYKIVNHGDGAALVWDSEKRRYIGHVEISRLQQEANDNGIDLAQWVGYGQGNWGSGGW